jgi:hypothetical protein
MTHRPFELLINTTEQDYAWGASSRLATKQFILILWNPQIYCRIQNISLLSYIVNVHFIIILQYKHRYFKTFPSLNYRNAYQNFENFNYYYYYYYYYFIILFNSLVFIFYFLVCIIYCFPSFTRANSVIGLWAVKLARK